MEEMTWSKQEKIVARAAYQKALDREFADIIQTVKSKAQNLTEISEVWELEDYIIERRKDLSQKYDYRYSRLFEVFFILLSQGWLEFADLEGLTEDKLARWRELIQEWKK